nr:retrovirus-related Pol polyprotein from transposon TNT 1-94 [Tanacetum cinerariifolium]
MDNMNPPLTNNLHILPTALHARVVQELNELQKISTYVNSRLESINQFLNGFTQQPNEIDVDDLEPDDESVDTPLVSPFQDSDDDFDDREVLNELEEYVTIQSKNRVLRLGKHAQTLLNELSNDGVTLFKHEINVSFVNSLPKKRLSFSQGLRNANHTQTLDIADIYRRTSYKSLVLNSSLVSNGFQPKFTPKLIQSSQQTQSSQNKPKIQKDYKAEYKKMKAKVALLGQSLYFSVSKAFSVKEKGIIAETFDWDKEDGSDEEEIT